MSFQQVEASFWQIKGKLAAGQMTPQAFEAALKQLMIQDASGRWWTPQRDTGQWLFYDGTRWTPGTPPGVLQAPPPRPAFQPAAAAHQSAVQTAASPQEDSGAGGKILLWLVLTAAFWVVVAVVLWVATETPETALGVAAAGVLSIILLMRSLSESWEGVIERTEIHKVERGRDDDTYSEDVLMAVVRLTNGRTKTLNAMPDWRPGDRIVKRKGESYAHKL